MLKITLKRSLIGSKKNQIATAHSLCLKRPGDVSSQPDNDATKGKIAILSHLVEVAQS
ncbi:MAG: 50S ribosomal protein L30 [Oscillospiraceae bacterium]|nr:50S ribosomal protein L30 [Oscillospiraceae bacterium]